MPRFRLELSRQAEDVFHRIAKREPSLCLRVSGALDDLEKDPFQGKPLKGILKGRWSWRVGSYRIIYTILSGKLLVIVIDIGHRRDIYR